MSDWQTQMDELADAAAEMYGAADAGGSMELVTYHARSSPGTTPVDHADVPGRFKAFRQSVLTLGELLPSDRELRIQTQRITWDVGADDTVTRADGTEWKCVAPITGGPNHPWWKIPLRQIG